MEDQRELYCLVSVNSASFDSKIIGHFNAWTQDRGAKLRYVLLSYPERHNIRVFESVTEEEALSIADAHALSYREKLGLSDSELMTWKEICDRVGFEKEFDRVLKFYRTNRSFRAHCLSQTFSNLQPRFKAIGVKKKSDERVQHAASYLLEELAVKVGAFEGGAFSGEILPKEEMPVVKEIYAGSYLPCRVSKSGFQLLCWNHQGFSEVKYIYKSLPQ
jgi:hypothetical protein